MPPLPLDSKRWSELTHAYGSAADTPELLRRLYESPDDDVWSDLCGGSVVHQGDVSEAAYAALPHVVAAAESAPASDRIRHLVFAAAVFDGRVRKPCPDDLKAEYDEMFEPVREMATEVLKTGEPADQDLPYIFEAIAAASRLPVLARILESFSNEEFTLQCAGCKSWLYVSTEKAPFAVFAVDPVRHRDSRSTSITPPERPGADPKRPTSCDAALPWLLSLSRLDEHQNFGDKLVSLYGHGECPKCGRTFNLYRELERAETEPYSGARVP